LRTCGNAEAKDTQGNEEAVYRDSVREGQMPQRVPWSLAKQETKQAETTESS
jgi:2-C-methyl-D-erythritol 4-phosphate cytidylyltransferase